MSFSVLWGFFFPHIQALEFFSFVVETGQVLTTYFLFRHMELPHFQLPLLKVEATGLVLSNRMWSG